MGCSSGKEVKKEPTPGPKKEEAQSKPAQENAVKKEAEKVQEREQEKQKEKEKENEKEKEEEKVEEKEKEKEKEKDVPRADTGIDQTESEDVVAASPAGRDGRPSVSQFGSGVKNDIGECVGHTPMVWLKNSLPEECKARIAVKLESENPAKSVKDRLGVAIIEAAEKNGLLIPGKSTIIEATSGNTGIALAMIGAARGYKVILTMPHTMSIERRCLLKAYGAEVILTPASKGVKGAVFKAEQIAKEIEGSVLAKQFETAVNAQIHEDTTGPEIWKQTDGDFDAFVAGVGTGGTITGCARYFKAQGSNCQIVAVEPAESPVLSGGQPGPHKIQGIGAGFKPHVLDMELVDEVIPVASDDAIARARTLPPTEGLLVGMSSGAAIEAAIRLGCQEKYAGKTIVAVIPSYGERYFSTALFSDIAKAAAELPVCTEEECTPEG